MPGPEPRMDIPGKLIIRTYAPVRRWLVLLVLALLVMLSLYLAYELGHYQAGFDGIEAAQERSAALEAELDNSQLWVRLAELEEAVETLWVAVEALYS